MGIQVPLGIVVQLHAHIGTLVVVLIVEVSG